METYEDFDCEEAEEEIVEDLLKFGIYGKQTTLDSIVEEAEKNLNETKARIAKLKTLFGDKKKSDNHCCAVPGRTEVKTNDANISENKDTTSVNDSSHKSAGEINDTANKDLDLPKFEKSTSQATPGTTGEPSKKTTIDISPQLLELSFHHDTEGKQKHDVPLKTYTPTTLVNDSNKETVDMSFLTTTKPRNEDVHIPSDAEREYQPVPFSSSKNTEVDTNAYTSTTLVHDGNEATDDISLPTTTELRNEEVHLPSDVKSDHQPVSGGSSKNSDEDTGIVSKKESKIKSSDLNSENKLSPTLILVDARSEKKESSDADVCKDRHLLPSSEPTCSEWQTMDDVHSSGTQAISAKISTAGCLPECEEPRSGCVNMEATSNIMSSEQVNHAPSTSIIEDRTKIDGIEEFPQYQNNVEDDTSVVTGNSIPYDQQENGNCKPKKKSKGKQKAKVHKKDKRSKDKKAEKTKSKKICQRFVSLFCCCFKRQESDDQSNEMEQSTTESKTIHCEDSTQ